MVVNQGEVGVEQKEVILTNKLVNYVAVCQ